MSAFDLKTGRGGLRIQQLYEVVLWHRGYGLKLAFPGSDASVSLDGDASAMVTELLRLAHLGIRAEADAPFVPNDLLNMRIDAAIEWQKRFI